MVIAEKSLSSQQNLRGKHLALVVLRTNNWNVLKDIPRPIAEVVDAAMPGNSQSVMLVP